MFSFTKGEFCIKVSGEFGVTSGDQGFPIRAGDEKSDGLNTGIKNR